MLFNAKAILEEQSSYNIAHSCEWGEIRWGSYFSQGINLKVNVIVLLEFELAYYNVTVLHIKPLWLRDYLGK